MPDNPLPLLIPERIKIIKKIESKKCAFDLLTELLEKGQNEVNKNDIFDALISREKLGSTCTGNGIAIPRAHMDIDEPIVSLLIIKKGLEIETVDNKPIKIFVAFIIPKEGRDSFSKLIQKLNLILREEEHLSFFTRAGNQELIANYFQLLLYKVQSKEQSKEQLKEQSKAQSGLQNDG